MTVDLSKARKGDKVRFKCGGEVELTRDAESFGAGWYISFVNNYKWLYWSNGCMEPPEDGDPFRIVELIQKIFDWSTARPGLAFVTMKFDGILLYVGPVLHDETAVVCQPNDRYAFLMFRLHDLIRAPEHDVVATA